MNDLSKIIKRTWNLFLYPRAEWFRISIDKDPFFYRKFFIFYLIINTIAYLIGVWFDPARSGLLGFIGAIVKGFGMPFTLMLFSSYLIYAIAPLFDSAKNLALTYKLTIYTLSPYLFISILTNIFYHYRSFQVVGLYGLIILYYGIPDVLRTPPSFHRKFYIVCSVIILLVYISLWISLELLAAFIFGLFR